MVHVHLYIRSRLFPVPNHTHFGHGSVSCGRGLFLTCDLLYVSVSLNLIACWSLMVTVCFPLMVFVPNRIVASAEARGCVMAGGPAGAPEPEGGPAEQLGRAVRAAGRVGTHVCTPFTRTRSHGNHTWSRMGLSLTLLKSVLIPNCSFLLPVK